jgi:hypothetical protein
MSDDAQQGEPSADKEAPPDKREIARRLAEAALAARRDGDDGRADVLMEQAERTDPEATEEVLAERGAGRAEPAPTPPSDAEVAALSRTVEPGSDAPSRANITGSGSGADNM